MNSDPEIIGWRTIIDEHESLQALRLCAIIQVSIRVFFIRKISNFFKLVVAFFGSCCIYRQWKQTDYYARQPTDWLSAGINIGVLISGLCGTISLHFGEQSIPLYQTYQAFIAFNFIGCIAVSSFKSGILRTGRNLD